MMQTRMRLFQIPVTQLPGPQSEARGRWLTATPAQVRYAWSNNPMAANLGGADGLLVSPFPLTLSGPF